VALQLIMSAAVVIIAIVGPRTGGLLTVRRVIATLLAIAAVVVALAAVRALGSALTPFPRPRPNAPLTRAGPYRHVRHPIYTALMALAFAVSLAGSLWALVPTAGLAVILDLKATREERWLVAVTPEYADFRRRVRWRFLPGVR
jgi:protein-S-isoprenylcysteine O-methyltransferase Ste14